MNKLQIKEKVTLKLYQITRKQRWIIENKYEKEEKSNIKHLNLPIYGYKKKKRKNSSRQYLLSEEISQHHKNVEAKIFQIPGQCNELCTITFPIRAERDKSSTLTNPMHTPLYVHISLDKSHLAAEYRRPKIKRWILDKDGGASIRNEDFQEFLLEKSPDINRPYLFTFELFK